jgi:hypothetical protein
VQNYGTKASSTRSRTGAPFALLRFLHCFKKNSNRPFPILLLTKGELSAAFAELTETWAVDESRWLNLTNVDWLGGGRTF